MKKNKTAKASSERLHAKDSGFKAASNIDFLLFICGVVIALLTVRAFIFEPVRVDGTSMQNTLQDGERCIVEKVGYWFGAPKSGDIVIVHYPDRGNESFVKRVIATGGQTIELRHEAENLKGLGELASAYSVYIDGQKLDESAYSDNFLFDPVFYSTWNIDLSPNKPYTVPEGYIFVMGDHRTNSHDSRKVGPIPLYDVVGRVHGVLYPFDSIRSVD